MRKISIRFLLPVVCIIALLCSSCGAMAVSGNETTPTPERASVDEIIARDGYLEGVWYPWFTHSYLGSGLTANPDLENRDSFGTKDYWQNFNKIGIDEYGAANIKREIYNLKALGYNILGYEGSPWGEGVIHDQDTGDVLGVREDYLNNIRRFLDICREVEMPVLWAMCFHTSAAVLYSNLDLWYFVCQMYSNPTYAENYANRFVRPVCEVLAEYPDVVVMTCSTVEIENEINDSQNGNLFTGDRQTYGVTQEDAVYFVKQVTKALKEGLPDVPVTIATNSSNFAMYADCDFDMIGRNQYSSSASATDLTGYYPTAPMLATEWGVSSDAQNESTLSNYWQKFRKGFMDYNYAGWFQWAWEPTGRSGGGHHLLKNGATTTYDFRQATYEQYYYIEQYRAEKKPDIHSTGKPSMLYNDGSGTVYWIQPKGVSDYVLERSVNGGSWTPLLNGSGAIVDDTTGSYRYSYIDTDLPDGSTIQYRVTVNNKMSTSNVATLPTNLFTNGGFENGNTGWTYISSKSQFSSNYAHNGSYGLVMNETSTWGEAAYITGVPVEKNTNYTVSFWCKRVSGTGKYALFIKNGGTNVNAVYFSQTGTDWVYCEQTFYTGDYTTIDFRFQSNNNTNPGEFAIDDVKLFKVE